MGSSTNETRTRNLPANQNACCTKKLDPRVCFGMMHLSPPKNGTANERKRNVKKELEALVISAAKALNWAVSPSIPRKRVEEFGAVPSAFVRAGEVIPTTKTKAKSTGYYPIGQFRQTVEQRVLSIETDSAPERARYTLVGLSPEHTGHQTPFGLTSGTDSEVCAKLRGIIDAAYFVREQEQAKKGRRK